MLSTGNQFTEVILNKSKSTLIIGENGAGKSTLIEAIMYVLFGRPFRNINKPQLINSITGKNMLVEIEFSIGKKDYFIRRGMKPNIFEIFVDGSLIDQNSDIREYQEMLEKMILKMNHKSFRQVIILGSADYVPFMKLNPGDRRQIIEDFLDIQIFSIMNNLLKEKITQNKSDIVTIDNEIALISQRIELNQKHVESLKTNNQELISGKKKLIERLQLDISNCLLNIAELNSSVDKNVESISDLSKITSKKNKILEIETDLENKRRHLNKEIKFFSDHDTCPTCKQDIDSDFKRKTIEKKRSKYGQVTDSLVKIEEKVKEIDDRLSEINDINDNIAKLNKEISAYNSDIRSWNSSILTLQEEIKAIEKNTTQIDVSEAEVQELEVELIKFNKEKKKFLDDRDILDISSSLLKDTGIKTRIIKQYVPIINRLVNKYLAALDFFVNFELDEKFNETIKSRFRDEFSYASFSEGEKFRIDISLMFTWRAIAKLRNSSSTNLLIMDEVFDSSLDGAGVEEFLKILETLSGDTNTFIISHRPDALYDKFHSVIKFEKHSNFSRIAK